MIYEAIFRDTEVGWNEQTGYHQKFICFALGIIMVIAGAYFADVQAEAVGRLEQSPALVSLMSPELARSTQDTAEEPSGLRQACGGFPGRGKTLSAKERHCGMPDYFGGNLFFGKFSLHGKEKTVLHSL